MTAAPADGRAQVVGDPVANARFLARVREAVLGGSAPPSAPRKLVSESWQRSLAARVDPERGRPPQLFGHDEVQEIRRAHPLAEVLPLLRDTLVEVADEAMHMMIVTDADGLILWCEGQSDVLRRGEDVGLTVGTRWAEDSIGTNAMGTALAAGRAVQIHSAEHLVRTYHSWTCAASPVRDPDTGRVIGAVDVTGPLRTFHPATISLVTAASRLAEGHLRDQMHRHDAQLLQRYADHLSGPGGEIGALVTATGRVLAVEETGQLPSRVELPEPGLRITLADGSEAVLEPLADGYLLRGEHVTPQPRRPLLTMSFLGASQPVAELRGRELRLSLRHAEMLTMLALHPDGLTADQLATELYGEHGNPITARAELHRLRLQVGTGVVRAKPYRLDARVDADFIEVRRALRDGRVTDAARIHHGPLLPRSESPGIRDERESLCATLRRAVLDRGDTEALWALADAEPSLVDPEVSERLLQTLPRADPRRAIVAARHERRDPPQ